MVAVARPAFATRERPATWVIAAFVVLFAGTAVRLAVRPVDVAAVSAALLAALLWLGVWAGAVLLLSPRGAFLAALVTVLVLDFGALQPRMLVPFDDQQALYSADQVVTLPAPGGTAVVLVDAVFDGAQPTFGLAGYSCALRHGQQALALPMRTNTGTVELRLAGAPNREREYLIVYTSASQQQAALPATVCQ